MKETGNYLSNKKEFIAVDVCKVLCAYGVVSIHLLPFADVSWELMFWFNQVLCRLAVPFFFLSSGFFLYNKIHDKNQVCIYIKRLLWLYLFYTIVHFGLILKNYWEDGFTGFAILKNFLRDFFRTGSYVQFWYLPALVIAVLLCYLVTARFRINERILIVVTCVFYILGVLINAYSPLFSQISGVARFVEVYLTVFGTARNGILFGFPYVFWGMLFKKYAGQIQIYKAKSKRKKVFISMFAVCMLGLAAEAYMVRALTGQESFSMLFMTPLTVSCLFLSLCSVEVSLQYAEIGKWMRKISFLIYAWHMFVHKYFGPYVYYKMDSQWYYLVIILSTTVLAGGIVYFSKYERFKWLRYLY